MKKVITYKDIIKLNSCYTPKEIGMNENYSSTIPEFIEKFKNKVRNKGDIIWLLARHCYMTDKDMRLFAVWCAREALKLFDNPDERSINACNVAEKYANGQATDIELTVAWSAAEEAAPKNAMWSAAEEAAKNAMWSAARSAMWSAEWSAEWSAARSAMWSAARNDARDVWDAQLEQLKTYFK